MAKAFAIIHTWPDLKNAEYEVLQRLLAAAENIGRPVVVIDNDGVVLWATKGVDAAPGISLSPGTVEFVISLHFESPRVVDVYSYYALWQPLSFYKDFGYEKSTDKFLTHCDVLSCDSDMADAHAASLFESCGVELAAPYPKLFHALPQPYLEPCINAESRLFYIGINWERVGRPKGRFHDALVSLDGKGLISIYGPEKLFGVAPWEGFQSYEGELPFDGRSVKAAVNRAGICLALSSAAHRETGIMSNRLFEGLAGGAAVVATPNPLIDKHFRDVVYMVDDSRGEEVLGQQVLEAVREIRSNPAKATRRVLEGQRIMRDVCSLEQSLEFLFDHHPARLAHFERQRMVDAQVTVILIDDHGLPDRLAERIEDYRGQKKCEIDLHVIAAPDVLARLPGHLREATGGLKTVLVHPVDFAPAPASFDGITPPAARSGPVVDKILAEAPAPYFLLAGIADVPFADHLSSLAKALMDNLEALFACSGVLRQTGDVLGRKKRVLSALRFTEFDALTDVEDGVGRGNFLFRRTLADKRAAVMLLLDGEEHRYFQLAANLDGQLAQTNYASFMVDGALGVPARLPAIDAEMQRQYIRDAFIGDPRRIAALALLPSARREKGEDALSAWPDHAAPCASRERIELDHMLSTGLDGKGVTFLTKGFSHPEKGHIWITDARGVIDFLLPKERGDLEYEIVIAALGRRSRATGREQHCTMLLNGMAVAYVRIPESPTDVRIAIPRGILKNTDALRLEIVPDYNEPASAGDSEITDPRNLSVMIKALGLMVPRDRNDEMLLPGATYVTGSGALGEKILVRGFYSAEPTLTWIAGREGEVRFRLASNPQNPVLELGIWGRHSVREDEPQTVALAVNGRLLGTFTLSDRPELLRIPIEDSDLPGGRVRLSIAARHAEAVIDRNGNVIDGRLLGIAVSSVAIASKQADDGASDIQVGDHANAALA